MGKVYLTPSEARAVFDAVPLVDGKPSDDAALLHAIEDIIATRLEKVEAERDAWRQAATMQKFNHERLP